MSYTPKEKILTEGELCKWWGVTGEQVAELRLKRELPHVVINRSTRLYREISLVEWLRLNEFEYDNSVTQMNGSEQPLKTSETG